MGVMALRTLFKDLKTSVEFAQVHMNMSFPAFFDKVGLKHLDFAERMRKADDNSSSTGMAEVIIRRGLGPKHWAGAGNLSDYKSITDLKDVDLSKVGEALRDLRAVRSLRELIDLKDHALRDELKKIGDNKGVNGLISIGTTAFKSAAAEIGANSWNELGPELQKVLAEEIASVLNAQIAVNGDTSVTVNAGDILKAVHGN